jgi:RNA polymerase sigma-70 factor, ECF subfamily
MSEADDADRAAMDRLADGDDSALSEIIERWKVRLTAFLLRHLGDEAAALDLAEETFVRVYQFRERYRPKGAFSSWLFGIAMNLSRQHIRWRKRHPTISLDSKVDETGWNHHPIDLADPGKDPGAAADHRERAVAVKNAVSALPADLREALILFEYEEMGQIEISRIIGCSAKAVECRIAKARGILREKLTKYFSN